VRGGMLERGRAGGNEAGKNYAVLLSIPPNQFSHRGPARLKQKRRSGPCQGTFARQRLAARWLGWQSRKKPLGPRTWPGAGGRLNATRGIPGGCLTERRRLVLSASSLPRQETCWAEHPWRALRQRDVRADLEPPELRSITSKITHGRGTFLPHPSVGDSGPRRAGVTLRPGHRRPARDVAWDQRNPTCCAPGPKMARKEAGFAFDRPDSLRMEEGEGAAFQRLRGPLTWPRHRARAQ